MSNHKRNPTLARNCRTAACGRCQYCNRQGLRLSAHHIVPLALGGLDVADNLIALCPDCHRDADLKAGLGPFRGTVSTKSPTYRTCVNCGDISRRIVKGLCIACLL